MSDCLCEVKRGIVCAMHAFRASDLDAAAEWLAMATEERERGTERETHHVRVSLTVALSVEGYEGISVDWSDVASGEVLVSYPAIGDGHLVSEVALVPLGLLSTDAEMRRVQDGAPRWTRYAWRDGMCASHGEPLPRCPECVKTRKAASNERLVKARAALAAKRAAAKEPGYAVTNRERISNAVREHIGVLPLD